jgi:hypothetical protein
MAGANVVGGLVLVLLALVVEHPRGGLAGVDGLR